MRIRVGRIIAYLIGLALTVFMFGYFRAFFFLLLFVIETVMTAADIASVVFVVQRIGFSIETPVLLAEKNDPVFIIFRSENPTFIPSFELSVYLDTDNSFYGTHSRQRIQLPLRARGETVRKIPLEFSQLGNYTFHAGRISVRDLLGFVDLYRDVDATSSITVMPDRDRSVSFDPDQAAAGMTEADETDRRGNDFSDVSEIREYVPGDRPRDIHWKLSAKKDELMVKQRSSMSDSQMVVVVDFTDVVEDNDKVIEEAYSLVRGLESGSVNTRLMWWNTSEEDFHARRISEADDVDAAFIEMFNGKAESCGDIDKLMRSVHPEIVSYLKVCFTDARAQEIVVNGS